MVRNLGLACVVALWGCAHAKEADKRRVLDEDGEPVAASPPRPQPEENTPTGAGVTPEQNDAIDALFRRKTPELQRCWSDEYEKSHDRKLEVELTLSMTITPAGQASDVRVLKSAPQEHAGISACVTRTVAEWSFPEGPAPAPYRRTVHLGAQF